MVHIEMHACRILVELGRQRVIGFFNGHAGGMLYWLKLPRRQCGLGGITEFLRIGRGIVLPKARAASHHRHILGRLQKIRCNDCLWCHLRRRIDHAKCRRSWWIDGIFAMHHHPANPGQYHLVALVVAVGAHMHHAGLAAGVIAQANNFGFCSQGVADENRLQKPAIGVAKIGYRVVGNVGDRLAEGDVKNQQIIHRHGGIPH